MPSSPQVAILKDGHLLSLLQRTSFLDRSPEEIADEVERAYAHAGTL